MPFVEPFLLWGALAVGIPIAIHFWHQKQGKPLPWAATQWLSETRQQQSRGLRLDNILLLLIRCLVLIVLAVLLAKPLLNGFTQPPPIQRVHLVEPSQAVLDNFRFELTEARKKGERVLVANQTLTPLATEASLPQTTNAFGPLSLQTAINQLDTKNTVLHLYLTANQTLSEVPAITVPTQFRLHSVADSVSQPRAYLLVKDGRKLFVDRAGKLTVASALDPTLKFQPQPAHTGPIRTLVSYRRAPEKQTVKAALTALADVYQLELSLAESRNPTQSYDWVLTDQLPDKPVPQTLYVVSGTELSTLPNVVFSPETLTPQSSERVLGGQLPEWLGNQLLRQYGLTTPPRLLSRQELNALFTPTTRPAPAQHAGARQILLLFFVSLLIVERWLALTRNA